MHRLPLHFAALALLLSALLPAMAQEGTGAPQTLVVLPFENVSTSPGLEWVGESFPEVLGQRLASESLRVVGREERVYAYDRLGLPSQVSLSRATLYRIAAEMDVDYVVLGRYDFDGRDFTAAAQLLEMKSLRLGAELKQSGPLVKLLEIENALAWDVLRQVDPGLTLSRNDFIAAAPLVRVDALENYIRGVLSSRRQDRLRYFREAVRGHPEYWRAVLALGKTLFEARDFQPSGGWLARIPRKDPLALEAHFFLGLDHYFLGDYPRAEAAFRFLASRLPLTEVYNNLGVVTGRQSKNAALEYFQKAVATDPADADYLFNLAVALYREGQPAEAVNRLRAVLALHPLDAEASGFLQIANATAEARGTPPAGFQLPLERIKTNYDESYYRQVALAIQKERERKLVLLSPYDHARVHTEQGRDALERGFVLDAEREFREAIALDPVSAPAHAGLAQVLERTGDPAGARAEARAALRLAPSADGFLVLARLDLSDNNLEAAALGVDRALALEPGHAAALALKRTVAAKLAEKAPRLPQP
ncbi:MAG: tetratricopeptide repeat protein [Acidobacteria bacterium]|nr:tetratricopeptide repeat protein [Acidobacteriota bacterium]